LDSVEALGFGDEDGFAQQLGDGAGLAAVGHRAQQVLGVDDAGDVVDVFLVDGHAAVPALVHEARDLLDGGVDIGGGDVDTGDHDLAGGLVLEGDDAADHALFLLLDAAGGFLALDDAEDVVLAARGDEGDEARGHARGQRKQERGHTEDHACRADDPRQGNRGVLRGAGGEAADGHFDHGDEEAAADAGKDHGAKAIPLLGADGHEAGDDEGGEQDAPGGQRAEEFAWLFDGTHEAAGAGIAARGGGTDADIVRAFEGGLGRGHHAENHRRGKHNQDADE